MLARNTVRILGAHLQKVGKSTLVRPTFGFFRNFEFEVLIPEAAFSSIPYKVAPSDVPDIFAGVDVARLWLYCAVNGQDGSETWYGFHTWEQRQFFLQLMKADGVGPGSAYKIMDAHSWVTFADIIASNDQDEFRKLKGIGPKTADKLIPILFAGKPEPKAPKPNEDAVAALCGLGYKKADASAAVLRAMALCEKGASTEELVKISLIRK